MIKNYVFKIQISKPNIFYLLIDIPYHRLVFRHCILWTIYGQQKYSIIKNRLWNFNESNNLKKLKHK